jgi:hypothetical protein
MTAAARWSNVVIVGQHVNQQFAEGAAGAILPRAHRAYGNLKLAGDRFVVHFFDDAQDQDGPLLRGNSGERLLEYATEVFTLQMVRRIIAITDLDTLKARLNLVSATARLATCQVQAAMSDSAGQPRAEVCRHFILKPQADKRLLDRVPGLILVAENAPRDRDEMPEQGACRFCKVHLRAGILPL